MNWYVNYFEEISGRSKEEQSKLLEQARFYAFSVLKLNGRSVIYGLLCFMLAFFLIISVQLIFSPSIYVVPFFTGASIYFSLLLLKKMNSTLIYKGLKAVLANEGL